MTNYSADGANMAENGVKLLGMTNELLDTTGMRIQYLRDRVAVTVRVQCGVFSESALNTDHS